VTAPLVYLVLLAVILCGDVVLASLRFEALLGIPVDGLPIGGSVLDLLTGLLFLAVLATYGCVCWTSPGSPRCAVRTGSQTAGPARRSSAPLSPGRPCRCSRPRCSSCGAIRDLRRAEPRRRDAVRRGLRRASRRGERPRRRWCAGCRHGALDPALRSRGHHPGRARRAPAPGRRRAGRCGGARNCGCSVARPPPGTVLWNG
jgi:hypothetical protein